MLVNRILNRISVLSRSQLVYQVLNFKRSASLFSYITNKMSYSVVERGSFNTLNYKLYFRKYYLIKLNLKKGKFKNCMYNL